MAILGATPLDLDTVVLDMFDSTGGGVSVTSSAGRSGGNSLHFTGGGNVTKNIGSNVPTLNVAWAASPNILAAGTPLIFSDGGTAQVTIQSLIDGTITAKRGTAGGTLLGSTSPGALTAATFQHIEMSVTISATVGIVSVWINSVQVLNLTSQNTKSTANTTVSGFTIGQASGSTVENSDIIWSTTRINDSRVECLVPTGAGNYAQFTPSAGSNWQNVDEVPPNSDTDYNETLTLNNIDSFTHGNLSAVPLSITAVLVNVRARNTTTGAGSVAPFIRSAGTDAVGTSVALNTTYQDFQTVWETDPHTGSAWANAAAVNAAEFGYKKTV